MNERSSNDWLANLPALTQVQKQRLKTVLASSDPATDVIRDELDALGVSECPQCAPASPICYECTSVVQRYKRHSCRHTFNVPTGTSLAQLRNPLAWRVFAQVLTEGQTAGKSAQTAGVHRNIALRWRHRFRQLQRLCESDIGARIAEADKTVMRRFLQGLALADTFLRERAGSRLWPTYPHFSGDIAAVALPVAL